MKYTTINIVPGNTLEEQQEVLLQHPLLRLHDNYVHDPTTSLTNFIKNFLRDFRNFYKTYKTTQRENPQCNAGKLRSMIDIFRICRWYYPDCTLRQVREYLLSSSTIKTQICNLIQRRVFWDDGKSSGSVLNMYDKDEFGLDFPWKPIKVEVEKPKEVTLGEIR